MVGGRIARFLICNIAAALRSKGVMWLIADNRAGSILRRPCFIFGGTASAILSKMHIVLRTALTSLKRLPGKISSMSPRATYIKG
jgi:hypothetical protein